MLIIAARAVIISIVAVWAGKHIWVRSVSRYDTIITNVFIRIKGIPGLRFIIAELNRLIISHYWFTYFIGDNMCGSLNEDIQDIMFRQNAKYYARYCYEAGNPYNEK